MQIESGTLFALQTHLADALAVEFLRIKINGLPMLSFKEGRVSGLFSDSLRKKFLLCRAGYTGPGCVELTEKEN